MLSLFFFLVLFPSFYFLFTNLSAYFNCVKMRLSAIVVLSVGKIIFLGMLMVILVADYCIGYIPHENER